MRDTKINKNEVLDEIRLYVDLGWIVLPQGETKDGKFKKPLVEWQSFNQDGASKPTYEQVIAWVEQFGKLKDRNNEPLLKGIGAISGKNSGFVIIDLDSYKDGNDGDKMIKLLEKVKTPVSKTGGGGLHYFFKYNPNIKTGANLALGIDTRGKGGNVVLPPSNHHSFEMVGNTKVHNRYEWKVSPRDCELAEIPNEVIEYLSSKSLPKTENKDGLIINSYFDMSKFYGKGERDDKMMRSARSFISIFPRHRWERDAWSAYVAWCEKHITDNYDGFVNEDNMRLKFNYAMRMEMGEKVLPSSVEDLLMNDEVINEIFRKDRVQGIKTGYQRFDSSVGGIFSGVLTLIAAQTGVGKSIVFMNFIDKIVRDKKIAYYDLENGVSETLERIIRIRYGYEKKWFEDDSNKVKIKNLNNGLFQNYNYFSVEDGIRDLKTLKKNMEQMVDKGVEVVVIDTLQKIDGGDDNKLNGRIIGDLSDFAKRHKIAVLVCHHVRKSATAGGTYAKDMENIKEVEYLIPSLEDVKGGSIITDTAEIVWGLSRAFASPDPFKKSMTLLRVLKARNKGDSLGKDNYFFYDYETLQLKEKIEELSFYKYKWANGMFVS